MGFNSALKGLNRKTRIYSTIPHAACT